MIVLKPAILIMMAVVNFCLFASYSLKQYVLLRRNGGEYMCDNVTNPTKTNLYVPTPAQSALHTKERQCLQHLPDRVP